MLSAALVKTGHEVEEPAAHALELVSIVHDPALVEHLGRVCGGVGSRRCADP
jgi:hypothetical protein